MSTMDFQPGSTASGSGGGRRGRGGGRGGRGGRGGGKGHYKPKVSSPFWFTFLRSKYLSFQYSIEADLFLRMTSLPALLKPSRPRRL